jgi:hypothetical protein
LRKVALGEIAMRPPGSRIAWVIPERTVSCRSAGCEKSSSQAAAVAAAACGAFGAAADSNAS